MNSDLIAELARRELARRIPMVQAGYGQSYRLIWHREYRIL